MLGYLKRRFSSGDLQGEVEDQRQQEGLPSFLNPFNTNPVAPNPATQVSSQHIRSRTTSETQIPTSTTTTSTANMSYKPKSAYPSAPTSPTRSMSSNPMESITGQISSTFTRGLFGSSASNYSSTGKSTANIPKGKYKTILVIDEPHTDWSKYFRGRKIFNDYEIRVEQAQFQEINLVGNSEYGCTIDVQTDKAKGMRSFKPDFLVLRQSTNDTGQDYKALVMGFLFSSLPGLNSLHAVYNMHERIWMFAHLELVRNRLGRETFPLIEQTYYPSFKEMVVPTKFPMVVKIGNCRNGQGKIKVDNHFDFQDIASIVAISQTYATSEPFIDAKCDVILQKIGTNFKAFQRKSLSGSWKTNTGSAILEQVPMNDKFRLWITEVSKLFGGLEMCSLKILQSKTDEYFIYELKGSNMNLFGETQEEDRKLIAELIMSKLQVFCRPNLPKAESLQSMNNNPVGASSAMIRSTANVQASTSGSMVAQGVAPGPVSMDSRIQQQQQQQHHPSAPQQQQQQQLQQQQQHHQMATTTSVAMDTRQMQSQPQSLQQPLPTSQNNYGNKGQPGVQQMLPIQQQNQGAHTSNANAVISNTSDLGVHSNIPSPQPTSSSSRQQGPPPAPSAAANLANNLPSRPNIPPRQTSLKSNASVEDSDDTMKNLRKTFAGIFGDM